MAQASYESLDREYDFRYCTLCALRQEGVTEEDLNDQRALKLIRKASKIVNRVTNSFFIPIEKVERISVRTLGGLISIHRDDLVPFLDVRSINLDLSGGVMDTLGFVPITTIGEVPPNSYRIDNRFIRLIIAQQLNVGGYLFTKQSKFSKGNRHIIIDGTYGQLDRRIFSATDDRKLSTKTTSILNDGDTTISVEDGTGFRVRDVIILRSGTAGLTYTAHAIITAVSGNTITVEPLIFYTPETLPIGSTIITYGQVPEEVEEATIRLVIRNKFPLGSDEAQQVGVQGRIIRERTDNYEYQLAAKVSTNIGSVVSTGDDEIDRLLSQVIFDKPPYIGGC